MNARALSVISCFLLATLVACPGGNSIQKYTVGGTLFGLAASSSLVLHNNGGDTLTLLNNGDYTFATALAEGTAYNVTVSTQPSKQFCTITNASGIISNANVNTVTVTCINQPPKTKNWGSAAPISLRTKEESLPKVAFDANGNAMAVWESIRFAGSSRDIVYSRYTKNGWSTPEVIPLLFPKPVESFYENSRNPDLAVAADGHAIAVWRQGGDTEFEFNIWASQYTPGSGWSQRERISDSVLIASEPKVAFDSNGNALAVWNGTGIQYNRYTVGVGWGPTATPRFVSAFAANAQKPELAVNSNGDAMAVWAQNDQPIETSVRLDLWSSRYSIATDTWGQPQLIETDNSGSLFYAKQVVMDAIGTATVVWSQYDGTRLHVLANRHAAGAWGAATTLEADNNAFGTTAFDPRITIDGNGNILAMWRQYLYADDPLDEFDEVFLLGFYMSARFTPQTGWGIPVRIGRYANRASSSAYQIVSNTAGNAVAVWTLFVPRDPEIVFGPQDVFSNRYTVGSSGWGTAETIGLNADESEYANPAITSAIDSSGNAVAVWSGVSATQNNDIMFNRLE